MDASIRALVGATPDAARLARRGVGRQVLARCEQAAAREGFRTLELMSTIAGEPLYLACGYSLLGRIEAPTSRGVTIPLARMVKRVSVAPTVPQS